MNIYDWSVLLLVAFSILAAYDGLYLHLWRYRLHERPESRMEHLWHTAGALIFVPALLFLFVLPASGALLWTGVALVAIGTVIEVFDASSERASRANIGGLTPFESSLHVVLTTLKTLAVVLAVLSRPDQPAGFAQQIAMQLVPGALSVAVLHVVLALRPMAIHRAIGACACSRT